MRLSWDEISSPWQGSISKRGEPVSDEEAEKAIRQSDIVKWNWKEDDGVFVVWLRKEDAKILLEEGYLALDIGDGYTFEAEMP